jgi:glycine/D-amino acid oxidase-like deaminating enzyme
MTRSPDVVVVGGGVIGSAVAYYAAKRGLRVTLIDQPKRGRATFASAGGLWAAGESVGLGCGVIFHKSAGSPDSDSRRAAGPSHLPRSFLDFSVLSNAMFPQLAQELREYSGMDIEWERTSLLFLLYDELDESFAQSIRDRCAEKSLGTEWLTTDELAKSEPVVTRHARGALRFQDDDQVNPYALATAFQASARSLGATVLSHSAVQALRLESGRVTGVGVSTGWIPCDWVVNAAGAWAGEVGRMARLEIPVRPVRGQLIGTETLPRMLTACLSTTDCYLLQKKHGEILIGSTTEEVGFATGVTHAAVKTLSAGAVRAIPCLEHVHVKRIWSGLRPATPDELPILGPAAGLAGYLNACGHFRTGIVNAPLTGLIVSELAAGEPPTFSIEPFSFSRFNTSA